MWSKDQQLLLMRSLLACAMRRLGITKLEVDNAEFEAKDSNDVAMLCKVRPGGGFIVTMTENVKRGN